MKLSEKLEKMMKKMMGKMYSSFEGLLIFFGKIQDLSKKHLPKILHFIIAVLFGIIMWCSVMLCLCIYFNLYLPFYFIMNLIIGTIEDIEDKKLSFYSVGLLALLLISSLIVLGIIEDNAHTYNDSKYYICTGSYSEVYHYDSDCSGLYNCGGNIIGITKEEAQNMNRIPCMICIDDDYYDDYSYSSDLY